MSRVRWGGTLYGEPIEDAPPPSEQRVIVEHRIIHEYPEDPKVKVEHTRQLPAPAAIADQAAKRLRDIAANFTGKAKKLLELKKGPDGTYR
jgi:hypothetical protein